MQSLVPVHVGHGPAGIDPVAVVGGALLAVAIWTFIRWFSGRASARSPDRRSEKGRED